MINRSRDISVPLEDENGKITRKSIIKFLDENHYFNEDYNNMSMGELIVYAMKELYIYVIIQAIENHNDSDRDIDIMSIIKAHYLK